MSPIIPKEDIGPPSIAIQIPAPPSEIAVSLTSRESIFIIILAKTLSLPFSFQFFTRLAAVFAEEVEDFRLVRYTVKHPPAIEPKNIKAIG